ncbi:hypothetical protein AGLY_010376 [Aphis glycines]|uniref:Uncharacterized protein n=1 Tax=Aphis glycines TaxID=307491 RepID=A0A6G0TI14_APHGL|nr:hypothetical protein AGLY_010376 [Aphis glycines]
MQWNRMTGLTSRRSRGIVEITSTPTWLSNRLKNKVHRPGIEPGSQEWESCMIPLHQRCSRVFPFYFLPYRNRAEIKIKNNTALPSHNVNFLVICRLIALVSDGTGYQGAVVMGGCKLFQKGERSYMYTLYTYSYKTSMLTLNPISYRYRFKIVIQNCALMLMIYEIDEQITEYASCQSHNQNLKEKFCKEN